MERDIAELDFAKGGGILPVIVQDARSKKVLMLAYMNVDAWQRTVDTGRAWFYSRSRKALWMKGEESGHVQQVKDMSVDCDGDTLLLRVEQEGGAACHEGYETCFYRRRTDSGWEAVEPRRFDPATVYRR